MNEPPNQPDGLGDPAAQASGAHEGEPPRGTLFLTLVYLVVVIGLWTYMYLRMTAGS
jgi:hypothetical protein